KDSSFERFTRLVVYLADGAAAIAAGQDEPCTVEAVASQLQLWIFESARATTGGPRRSRLDRCAEAASLLYASDVPSSLVPGDGSISWVKQYADKALQLAEEYCRSAEYKLAESTLASLSDFLQGSHGDPAAEPLRKEIADHLGEVRRKAQAHAQLELYQTCTNLIQQASQFCRGTDLCQAEFDGAILLQRVQEAQERLENEDVSEGEARPLLGDLPRRIQGHLDRLRREDIERRIGVPREQLRANCPRDWREPVSREAYEALRKCQANDPHGLVEDWSVWRNRLDKHQAQYHFRQALADITNGGGDGHCAQEMLDQALGFDPCLTPASASLYCMLALRKLENPPEGLANTKTAILKTARELLQMEPLGPDAMWSPAVRTGLVQEACVLLERLIGAYHGLETELDGLWEALERGFAPAFAEAPPAVVREIRTVVDTCLKACPVHSAAGKSGIDPRNRLHVLQRTCQKVLLIAEGEERLHEGRPQDAKTLLGEGIESLARDGLAGNQDGQLFRRAVCALYLAGFGDQDPLYVQQRVLDELDRWVDRMAGPDHASECSVQHVAQRIADARERMSGPTHAEQTYAMDIVHK
ncbi:MAG: hypothetical protein ACM3VT_17510, partial [Solirubrobacterales bacterium]